MSRFEDLQRAAALKYSEDSPDNAPVVVASGMGYIAKRIVDIAVQNDVPVYKDDSLAGLLSQLNEGTEIPPELYKAVVDIYVYFLNYTVEPEQQNDQKKPGITANKAENTENKAGSG